MRLKLPRLFLYFLALVFILNIVQSYFTELIFDEAYYWYYAQNMSWGYFDHPPMVALLIKLGNFLFNGELGVRFVSCFLSIGTCVVLWLAIDNKDKRQHIPLFFILVYSMTLLHAYGFLTLPDTPLLFFTALFLLAYKRFLKKPDLLISILLGLLMAALMYSKYHAVLVILFVILSNIKLLKNKYAWLSVIIGILAYTPHLIWLFENDFVSIRYHLFERPNRAYEFEDFTLAFFINLVALFGFTFPWVYKSLFKTKPHDLFTKALLYLVYGVIVFFFISSFNRRVQTQWLIVVCVPMVLIVYNYILSNPQDRKWIFRMGILNIVILLFLRLGLVFEPLFPIVYETHGNKNWVNALREKAGDIPVVFENSYREAPMYAFYSGNPSYSLNNIRYRRNQYSIDGSESVVQGKRIIYISKFKKEGDIEYQSAKADTIFGVFLDNFQSFRNLKTHLNEIEVMSGSKELNFDLENPYDIDIGLSQLDFAVISLNKYKNVIDIIKIDVLPFDEKKAKAKAHANTRFKFTLPKDIKADTHYIKISVSENKLYWGINGENVKLPNGSN
ncbi:ArnT family glycosyltransferase [Eudoraea sp.]|uniref:ArnT family glycosyltransferase n=1 Tax=Eudoraea sp. TaxID=1979955 RepID=UPI003C71590C